MTAIYHRPVEILSGRTSGKLCKIGDGKVTGSGRDRLPEQPLSDSLLASFYPINSSRKNHVGPTLAALT